MMAGLGGMVGASSNLMLRLVSYCNLSWLARRFDVLRVVCCMLQVAQGMALGTGSALAHTAINSVFGSRHPDPVQVQQVSIVTCVASDSVVTLLRR